VLGAPGFFDEFVSKVSVRCLLLPLFAAATAPGVDDPMPGNIAAALLEPIRYRLVNGLINPDLAALGDEFAFVAFAAPCNTIVKDVLNWSAQPDETKDDVRTRLLCFATTSGGTPKFMAPNPTSIVAMSFNVDKDGGLEPGRAPGTVKTFKQLRAALLLTKCKPLVKVLETPGAAVLLTVDLRLVVACTTRCLPLPEGAVKGVSTATGAPSRNIIKQTGSHAPWPGPAFEVGAAAGAGARADDEEELLPELDVDESGINHTPGVTVAVGGINNTVTIIVDDKQIGPAVCALALPVVLYAPICSLNMKGIGAGMRPFGMTVLGYLKATEFKENETAATGARVEPALRTAKQVKALNQRADAGAYSAGKRVGGGKRGRRAAAVAAREGAC
jgi:hypothetical protein